MNPRFEAMVRQLAMEQGRSPEEVMADMLHQQLQGSQPPRTEVVRAPPAAPAPPTQQSYPLAGRFAGVRAPRDESDAEAIARYLQAEMGPDGVFGDGGMTAGGIFGGEPVATQGHDPGAHQRTATHALMALGSALAQGQRPAPPPVQARPMAPQYPPMAAMAPPQQVRVIERTVVYEGPAPQLPPAQWPFGGGRGGWPWG